MAAVALLAVACGGGTTTEAPDPERWPAIVEAARGQTLDLFMWGGSSEINRFVDEVYAPRLEGDFGIRLNRVPVADTVDAVNVILAELQAGRDSGGSVDLVWINGENFRSLRQAGALLEGWSELIPTAGLVNWGSQAVNTDFGLTVDGTESPWGSAQFQFVYDAARLDPADLPRSYAELSDWVRSHPGRFTYPAPPAFHGTRFVKQAFYELTGGVDAWVGSFDADSYESESGEVWDYLSDMGPFLWREGRTYPTNVAEVSRLFSNGEVDFTFTQLPGGIQADIDVGLLPETARPFVFDTGTIGDFHYLAIPTNAGDPEAAMVMADLVLDPQLQADKLDPTNGWGDGLAISLDRVPGPERTALEEAASRSGTAAVPQAELERVRLPEIDAAYTIHLEEGWDAHIRQGRTP